MLSKVKEMIWVLPSAMEDIIRFAVLIGLRPTESCESVRLLNEGRKVYHPTYYNSEQQCLEHFRFPNIFLRTTKKAFISYLSLDNYPYFSNP
jgi:hypothetical protein